MSDVSDEEILDKLFLQACDLNPAERTKFIEKLPPHLRTQVARLVAADEIVENQGLFEPVTANADSDHEVDNLAVTQAEDFRSVADHESELPDFIGPYKIMQEIGIGGMGQVLLGQQTKPVKRKVALKIIRTETPTRNILARFEAERQALAMMDHQNIAKVLDAGITENGRPYFAMELVNGIPITDYCDNNTLTLEQRLELFVQTCRAIQHAHQKGVIHRDIKPSNILVTQYDGTPVVKVIDFGLAKAVNETVELTERTMMTQFGQIVGTLAYISPEAAEMNALDVDTRSDVYSLGVVLYQLLTGSTPINKDLIRSVAFDRVLAMIREGETPRPSVRLSESGQQIAGISIQRRTEPKRLSTLLKGDLDWITVKALEKQRARRYHSPAALADDIQRFLDGDTVEARPPSFSYRLQKAYLKYKAAFVTAATIVSLLIIGLLSTAAMWLRASDAETKAVASKKEAVQKASLAVTAEKIARSAEANERQARAKIEEQSQQLEATLARSNFFLAVTRWNEGRAEFANDLLEQIPQKYRQIEWKLAARMFRGSDVVSFSHQTSVSSIDYHPSSLCIASGSNTGVVKIQETVHGEEIESWQAHGNAIRALKYSPDGTIIATGSDDKAISFWNADNGQHLRTMTSHTGDVTDLHFSADGTQIASTSDDKTVRVHDVLTGRETGKWDVNNKPERVRFMPDGKSIVVAIDGQIQQILLAPEQGYDENKQSFSLDAHKRNIRCLDISPDGTRIVSASDDFAVKVWDPIDRKLIATLDGMTNATDVCFSPDSANVAVVGADDRGVVIRDVRTGDLVTRLRGHDARANGVCYSPDGKRIATCSNDRTVRVWDASGSDYRPLILHEKSIRHTNFNSDGTRMAVNGANNELLICDPKTGQIEIKLAGHTQRTEGFAFHSNGNQIVSVAKDDTAIVWDVTTGQQLCSAKVLEPTCVAWSATTQTICIGCGNGDISLWQPDLNKIQSLESHTRKVKEAHFNPAGTVLVTVGADDMIQIHNAKSGHILRKQTIDQTVQNTVISPDGMLIAAASDDNTVKLWHLVSGQVAAVFAGHLVNVRSVCFSPDGLRIASGSDAGVVKLWEVSTGEELLTMQVLPTRIDTIAFNPDGSQLVCGGRDGTVCIYDLSARSFAKTLTKHSATIENIRFNEDGSQLISQSAAKLCIWNTADGQLQSSRIIETSDDSVGDNDHATGPIESADRRWLAVAYEHKIRLVDLRHRNSDVEKRYRIEKSKHDSVLHSREASRAEDQENLFCAAFHRGWCFKLNPDSASHFKKFQRAHRKLTRQTDAIIPGIVKEVLLLPSPE